MDDLRSRRLFVSRLVRWYYPWQIHPTARLSVNSKNEKSRQRIQSLPSTHQCGQRVWQRCLYQHPHKHTQHLNQSQPDPAPPCQLTKTVFSKWPCRHPSLIDLKAHKPDKKSIHNPTCFSQIQSWVFQFFISKSLDDLTWNLVANHVYIALFTSRKWNKVNKIEIEFEETIWQTVVIR